GQEINGTFAGLPEGAVVKRADGVEFQISYFGGTSGHDVVLTRGVQSAVTLTSSAPSGSNPGDNVTFTATVSGTVSGGGAPTGTATYFDGRTYRGSAPLDSTGQATLSTATLSVGNHNITVNYSGDSNFTGGSAGLTQLVDQASSSTALDPTSATVFGQSVS